VHSRKDDTFAVKIATGYLGIEWSRDRWRHVTLKGRGRYSNMFSAQGASILETAGDRDLMTMEHVYKNDY